MSLRTWKGNRSQGIGLVQVGGPVGQPAPFSHLPMVEDRQGKGLPLGVSAQISLKAKRVDSRDESFDGVERGAWNGCILSHVPPEKNNKGRVKKQRSNLPSNTPQTRITIKERMTMNAPKETEGLGTQPNTLWRPKWRQP